MASSLILTGGAAVTKTLKEEIAQSTHGFTVGTVLRWDYAQGKYATAKADTAVNAEVVGIVSEISDANNFYITYSGYIEVPALAGGSYPVLFLSGTTAGELDSSPPSFIGSVVKPVLSRSTNASGHILMNYLGTQIGGSSTVAIDEIQPVGTVTPYAGDAIPDTWLECNGASYAVVDYAELYEKLRNAGGDRVPLYGYVANVTGAGVVTANFTTGDLIQFRAASGTFTGGVFDSPEADVIGIITAITSNSTPSATGTMTVQVIPKYVSANKKFQFPTILFGPGVGLNSPTTAGTGNYRVLTSGGAIRGGTPDLNVSSVSVTHFNTPDLRARFPVGVNTSPIGESEADNTFNSALSAFALGEEGGSESLGTIINVATWNATSAESAVPSGSAVIKPPYLATKYIIKAKPYTRAAIVDGLDIPYSQLLVRDLRSRNVGGANGDLVFHTNTSGDSGNGTERMRLSNAGNVIVGASSVVGGYSSSYRLLDVAQTTGGGGGGVVVTRSNSVIMESGVDQSIGGIIGTRSVHPLVIRTATTERMRIDSTGNVGIGTTTPGATLDVNGTVRISGGGAPAIKLNDRLVAADTSGTLKWDTDLIENTDSVYIGFNTMSVGWSDTLTGTTVYTNQDITARTAVYTSNRTTLKRGVYFCQPYNNITYSSSFRASAPYYGRMGIQAISGTIAGLGSNAFPGINHHFNFDLTGNKWNVDFYTSMPYELTPFLVFVKTDTAVVKGVFAHQDNGNIQTVQNASVGMDFYLYRIS